MAVQNMISTKVDAGEMPFDQEDVAVMSWALGLAHGHSERHASATEPVPTQLTNEQIHEANDLLLAQYLYANPGALPSKTSALELMRWSHERIVRERSQRS